MKNVVKNLIGVMLIISILVFHANMSFATSSTSVEADKSKQQENNNKMKEIETRKQEVENIKDETKKEVEKLNIEITQYENQIEAIDDQIEQTNTKISEAEKKLKESQENFDKQEDALKSRLVALYEAGDTSYLDFLLSSESLTDLISNYYFATEIATYDTELLDRIEKEKQEIAKAKETLEQSKKELDTQKANKQSVSTQLQASKSSKDSYVSKLSAEEQELQSQIDQLKKDNQALDAEIKAKQAAIEAALKKQREEEAKKNSQKNNSNSGTNNNSSGSNSNTNVPSNSSSAGFIRPVNSHVTTGMYYSSGGYHGAVDFGAAGINGAPVYAVADGVVHTVKTLTTSYGNYILIAHSNGLYTLYAHGQAGSICVSEGQTVKQGQQIMRVGSTGNSTGPHLHFEVRTSPGTYSCRVNPLEYLP